MQRQARHEHLSASRAFPFVGSLGWRLASRTVVLLGVTSMLTDISSEMVRTILPVYFLMYLHLTPLQFGVLDGAYQGASACIQLVGGVLADRWRRYKEVAAVGYAVSAFSRVGMLIVGAAPVSLTALVIADRTGKGLRTAPRDALISLSSSPRILGQAFGVHRTLDTLGSMLGPLLAFWLLLVLPGQFDMVFVVSFSIAVVGLAALLLLVDNVAEPSVPLRRATNSLRSGLKLVRLPRFRVLVIAGAVLSLFTISDAFVFLTLQHETDMPVSVFPLLYTATSVIFLALALPAGRLADRLGRERMYLAGFVLLTMCIAVLLMPMPGVPRLVLAVVLLGGYYAATDGVLMALASGLLPRQTRATGLSLLTTSTSLGLLCSSLLFGALWSSIGNTGALLVFGGGLLCATGASFVLLRHTPAPEGLVSPGTRWLRHRGCTSCPLSELEHTCPGKLASVGSSSPTTQVPG